MLLIFALACGEPLVLPAPVLSPDILLLREWIPLQVDRSAGKAERFDARGCLRQAPNTWLWVHDPVLRRAADPWLYLNGRWEDEPWFCLNESQRWRMEQAVRSLPLATEQRLSSRTPMIVRFSALVEGQLRSVSVPMGREDSHPDTVELVALLSSLAAEGVWGLSPEDPVGDSEASLQER